MAEIKKFYDLEVGDGFEYLDRFYVKIKTVRVVVEEPLLWNTIGKYQRVNAVCTSVRYGSDPKFIGQLTQVKDDLEVSKQ